MSSHQVVKLASSDEREAWKEAFCKLVDHEDEQVVVGVPIETGEQVLLKLCNFLAEAPEIMPRHTVRSVNSYLSSDEQLVYGSTFGDGARVISRAIKCWTEKFNEARDRYLEEKHEGDSASRP